MDLNAHRVNKTYIWEAPLFVNEAQIPCTKEKLSCFSLWIYPCVPQKTHVVYLHCYIDMHSPKDQLSNFSVKLPLSLSVQARDLGAQKDRIIKTVVLSTHNTFLVDK